MRIYVTGNEDTARYHLPVVQARAMDFAERCKRAGLSQDAMAFSFEDTGTRVYVQYVFGQLQVQIASPVIDSIPIVKEDEDEQVVMPGTFYLETSLGYFWVRVRKDDEGISRVELEAFEAMKSSDDISSQEFVYPAMGHRTPGMLSGSFGSDDNRYVVSQASGVFIGKDKEKGTIKMPPAGNRDARINVQQNDAARGEFCIIDNEYGQSCFFKHIVVSLDDDGAISVEMKHGNVDMLSEGENGGIVPDNLEKIPCWIHRKCTGSYFSPSQTIGYHIDIGSDDGYFGNADQVSPGVFAIPSGIQDKLDNGDDFGGEDVFSYFNHAQELYRISQLAAAPLSIADGEVSLLLVSPTMIWDEANMCWGGYGNYPTAFVCLDLNQDYQRNIIAPQLCVVTYDINQGKVSSISAATDVELWIKTWDGMHGAMFRGEQSSICGPASEYSESESEQILEPCAWSENGTSVCVGPMDVPVTAVIGSELSYFKHSLSAFDESISAKKMISFWPGGHSFIDDVVNRNKGFYFVFGSSWKASFAAMWLTSSTVGNTCGICAFPQFYQEPGLEITFVVNDYISSGANNIQWIAENGTEFVNENLVVTQPLGVNIVTIGAATGSLLSFKARVPEHLAAPHEPVLLVGGVSYPSADVDGVTIECSYSLMSAPCECSPMQWVSLGDKVFPLGGEDFYTITGGCPPFEWTADNAEILKVDGSHLSHYEKKLATSVLVRSESQCSGSVSVSDICGNSLYSYGEIQTSTPVIVGPALLEIGESATYYHNLTGPAQYTGTLDVVTEFSNGVIVQAPSTIGSHTVSWDGICGQSASRTVSVHNNYDPETGYCVYPLCGSGRVETGSIVATGTPSCSSAHKACRRVGVWACVSDDCRAGSSPLSCCDPGSGWSRIYLNIEAVVSNIDANGEAKPLWFYFAPLFDL